MSPLHFTPESAATRRVGHVDVFRWGTNRIGPTYLLDRTWRRRDLFTPLDGSAAVEESHFAAGPNDTSPLFSDGHNGQYHARCSCCYLNFSHTVECHQEALEPMGDSLYQRWWNSLACDQRTLMLATLRLQAPEQVEVFSERLWHELHGWMRDELRPLCRESAQGGMMNSVPSST